MKDIKIIGGGPGDASYILPMARQAVEQSDLIIGCFKPLYWRQIMNIFLNWDG